MNILLCTVPVEAVGSQPLRKRSEGPFPLTPKLAISEIAMWMEKNGYSDYKYYDIDMLYPDDLEYLQFKAFIKQNKPDVVGLSAVVSTSYQQVKHIARIIKELSPDSFIVTGGYLASAANVILRKTDVDLCVIGDGEIAWINVLDRLKNNFGSLNEKKFEDIQGLAFLNRLDELVFTGYGAQVNKIDIPFVNYEILKKGLNGFDDKINNYFREAKSANQFFLDDRFSDNNRGSKLALLFLSKGCVAKCTFCQRYTKGYRVLDYNNLEEHINYLKTNFDVGHFLVGDENFGSNREDSYEVAKIFKKHDVLWAAAGVRCRSVTSDDVEFYRNNNCSALKFGVESGSQKMLDIMEKIFLTEDVRRAVKNCNANNVYSPLALMVGMPGENEKTVMKSGQFVGELSANLRIPVKLLMGHSDVSYALPLMGTPLYEYAKFIGEIGNDVEDEEEFINTLSDAAHYKRYYINLNGAPISEVIFWDWLLKLEASREFRKIMKGKELDLELVNKFEQRLKIEKTNPHVKNTQRSISFIFISNFVSNHLLYNKLVDSLPRVLMYPIIKYLLFLEHLIQKFIYKEKHQVFKSNSIMGTKNIRITDNEIYSEEKKKDRSLRNILYKKKSELGNIPFLRYGLVKKNLYYNEQAVEMLDKGL